MFCCISEFFDKPSISEWSPLSKDFSNCRQRKLSFTYQRKRYGCDVITNKGESVANSHLTPNRRFHLQPSTYIAETPLNDVGVINVAHGVSWRWRKKNNTRQKLSPKWSDTPTWGLNWKPLEEMMLVGAACCLATNAVKQPGDAITTSIGWFDQRARTHK